MTITDDTTTSMAPVAAAIAAEHPRGCRDCQAAAGELITAAHHAPVTLSGGALGLILSKVLGSDEAPATLGVTLHALPVPLVDWVAGELDAGHDVVDARAVLSFLGYRYDEARRRKP